MIDSVLKEEYKKTYKYYVEQKDEIKEINDSLNDVVKTLAKKMEVKPALLKKVLDAAYKKASTGEDYIADIVQVQEELSNS